MVPAHGNVGEVGPRDQHIAEAGVEGKSPLQHGILKVGACHHSGVQGGFAQVGAAEVGILQLGAVEAGSPQIRPGQVGFAQVAEVEGGPPQVLVGIVGTDQHLFGHIHRGVGRSRHQPLACEHHQRDQYGREASAHDRNHHRRTLEPFQGGMV